MKIRINGRPWLDGSPVEIPDEKITLVGGKEGVFACWREGDIIHLAAGDDGSWWEIGKYHVRWVPEILKAINDGVAK